MYTIILVKGDHQDKETINNYKYVEFTATIFQLR